VRRNRLETFLKYLDPFRTLCAMPRATQKKKRIKRRGEDQFEPRKTKINGEIYWQVNLPLRYEMRDGRRVRIQKRRTLKDRQKANTIAEQARIQAINDGRHSFEISDRLRIDAKAAANVLEPLGATILEAAKFYAEHLKQKQTSEKVSVVVEDTLAAKKRDNLRPRYLSDLRVRLNKFSEAFKERPIASISAGEIDGWLRNLPVRPVTRNTIRLRLGVLFAHAKQRGWCQKNPIEEVRRVRANASPIGILTPEQFAKVLEAASEATLPYWLLGGFAGLRRAEIERLEWKDIHLDLVKYRAFTQAVTTGNKEAIAKAEKEWRTSALIEVPALKAKTASRRFVQIQDNLAAWLEPYIGQTGNVCPLNLRKLLEADRTNAGFKGKRPNKTDPDRTPPLKRWPPNGLRHSFASYHVAHFNDAAKLALELGHTKQDLLFRHYRVLAKPEDAAKYWNIRPAAQTNLVAISA
jgi:integrase